MAQRISKRGILLTLGMTSLSLIVLTLAAVVLRSAESTEHRVAELTTWDRIHDLEQSLSNSVQTLWDFRNFTHMGIFDDHINITINFGRDFNNFTNDYFFYLDDIQELHDYVNATNMDIYLNITPGFLYQAETENFYGTWFNTLITQFHPFDVFTVEYSQTETASCDPNLAICSGNNAPEGLPFTVLFFSYDPIITEYQFRLQSKYRNPTIDWGYVKYDDTVTPNILTFTEEKANLQITQANPGSDLCDILPTTHNSIPDPNWPFMELSDHSGQPIPPADYIPSGKGEVWVQIAVEGTHDCLKAPTPCNAANPVNRNITVRRLIQLNGTKNCLQDTSGTPPATHLPITTPIEGNWIKIWNLSVYSDKNSTAFLPSKIPGLDVRMVTYDSPSFRTASSGPQNLRDTLALVFVEPEEIEFTATIFFNETALTDQKVFPGDIEARTRKSFNISLPAFGITKQASARLV